MVTDLTYPFHDECSVSVRVVVVGRGRQRASGSAARVVGAAWDVLGHRAQPRSVAELGTDKRQPNERDGRANEMG